MFQPARRGRILLVTGATGGCGRSTCVMNLAVALAAESRVLCLDSQGPHGITLSTWRQGRSHQATPSQPLPPDDDFGVAAYRANIEPLQERLALLREWPGDPRLLGSCLQQLAADYDYIVVDGKEGYTPAEQSVAAVADLVLVVGGLNLNESRQLARHVAQLKTLAATGQVRPKPVRIVWHQALALATDLQAALRQQYERVKPAVPLLATEIAGDAAYEERWGGAKPS